MKSKRWILTKKDYKTYFKKEKTDEKSTKMKIWQKMIKKNAFVKKTKSSFCETSNDNTGPIRLGLKFLPKIDH